MKTAIVVGRSPEDIGRPFFPADQRQAPMGARLGAAAAAAGTEVGMLAVQRLLFKRGEAIAVAVITAALSLP